MESEIQCYNRGCGQKYDPNKNNDGKIFSLNVGLIPVLHSSIIWNILRIINVLDSCCHHPGQPVFHDAYKGWSCCSKKCTDFTEFLNIKGCTRSKHSNIKPPEPEKTKTQKLPDIVAELPKPILKERMKRPPLETLLVSNLTLSIHHIIVGGK